MTLNDDIIEVVDEIVDDIDPSRVDRLAGRLELTHDELIERIVNELKARLLHD